MTILESPIARSEFHMKTQLMLERHERCFSKKKRTQQVTEKLRKQVIKTIDKQKKPAKTAKTSTTETTEKKEPSKAPGPSTGEGSKEPTKETAGTGTDDKTLKFWDVSGYQVKPFRNWIGVRIDSEATRKFQYKEWQDQDVAKQIATEFAKKAAKEMFEFRFAKTKKEKIERMKRWWMGKSVTLKNISEPSSKRQLAFVKEFANKDDAHHWLDILKSLNNKKLLKGQFDLMKSAEATRKATQEAYDKILKSNKVLVPEEDPQFMKNPTDGKDIWGTMFKKYEEPKKPDHPTSSIRVPASSLERAKLLGFEGSLQGELFGWRHQTLGWRVTSILTHHGNSDLDFHQLAKEGLAYLGFIRCDPDSHELTESDKKKLGAIAENHPALAILVSYPVPDLNAIHFLCPAQKFFCYILCTGVPNQ
eukprot:s918_g15.t1